VSTSKPRRAAPRTTRRATSGPVAVNLALQGGGSHGAFTWGVLDALLEDGSLELAGLSGTSAGAMNAAVLACGLARGGRDGAREALRSFWACLSGQVQAFGPAPGLPAMNAMNPGGAAGLAQFNLDSNPFFSWINAWFGLFSPYQFNPLNLNGLRQVVAAHVSDVELQNLPTPLYITATSVRTGQPKVFTGAGLSVDALMASACLPQLFQAVQINGEPYWDGGFVGNPALWPLFETGVADIVLVQLDPLLRHDTPNTAVEITDRLNEITFNASLTAEMRAIHFVQKLSAQGHLPAGYLVPRLHRIADDDALAPLTASSKYNTDARFLNELFVLGRTAAQHWLLGDRRLVGQAQGCDITRVFLDPR
jgi:NTE family protein